MNNFTLRAITGFFFIAFISGMTLYSSNTFLILLLLIGGLGMMEYYKIVMRKEAYFLQLIFTLLGLTIISAYFWIDGRIDFALFGVVLLVTSSFIYSLFKSKHSWKNIPLLLSGLFYIAFPLFLFLLSVMKSDGQYESPQIEFKPFLALNLFVLIWCSDTFAYLCGKAFGKHKLFEKISPKKTVEGFIGALVLTVGFSILLSQWFGISVKLNLLIAFLSVVFGTLGDLVESQLKREHQIKDSGTLIPGHGGILDRFDALFISLPFTTACYYFLA